MRATAFVPQWPGIQPERLLNVDTVQGVREVEEWMSQSSGIPLEELRPHMFLLRDRDATSHLMRSAGCLISSSIEGA